ncbi:hypothetical protein SRHO_G00018370 [Serrasalmus rhombeus]
MKRSVGVSVVMPRDHKIGRSATKGDRETGRWCKMTPLVESSLRRPAVTPSQNPHKSNPTSFHRGTKVWMTLKLYG